jgi:hypothetical protein
MKTNGWIVALAGLVAWPTPVGARTEDVASRITGHWELVSMTIEGQGESEYPYGEDAVGELWYGENGRFAGQVMRRERPAFASGDIGEGTPREIEAAFRGYVAYFGTYEVDASVPEIVHRVRGSLFPNWIGSEQRRLVSFDGESLVLSTPPFPYRGESRRFRAVWRRRDEAEPRPAVGGDLNVAGYLWRQSVEQVIVLNVDPEPFQRFVGDAFRVEVTEGKAVVIFALQDSQTNFMNGDDVGPSRDIHVWVAVEGPRDGDTLAVTGAEKTLETMSWFTLFGGSSHPRLRSSFRSAGLLYEPIEHFSMNHGAAEIRGRVSFDPETSMTWNAKPGAPSAELVGVNHEFYTRDENGKLVCTQVQALLKARAWGSPGTLQVVGGIGSAELIPAGQYPVRVNSYDPIWIRVSLNVPM